VFDLNSPLEGGAATVQDEEQPEQEHSLHDSIPGVRRDLDRLKMLNDTKDVINTLAGNDANDRSPLDWSVEGHYRNLASVTNLAGVINGAASNRRALEDQVVFADIPITELPSAVRPPESIPSKANATRVRLPLKLYRFSVWRIGIIFLTLQVLLIFAIYSVSEKKLERLFLTTYHDPTFAGFHTFGDPHAPTASQWLMLSNHAVSPLPQKLTAWLGELAYDLFGSTRFLDRSIKPNYFPT